MIARPAPEPKAMGRVGDVETFKDVSVSLAMEVGQAKEEADKAKGEAIGLKRKLEEEVKEKKEMARKLKKEEEERVEQERIRTENILHGNPLLNKGASAGAGANPNFKVARRWDDDVVFKNCAKNFDKSKKEFINDSLRSEFHKKFMDKYIK